MNNSPLIHLENVVVASNTISFDINKGDFIGIIGPNKSGKTTLAKILCGKLYDFIGKITKVAEDCTFSFSDYSADSVLFHYEDLYYQQRYNISDAADTITVEGYLKINKTDIYQQELLNTILPKESLKKKIIELSSGETRKVVLLKNLLKENDIHILDNPFTGLDTNSVEKLISLFNIIHDKYHKTVILLLNDNKLNIPFTKEINLQGPAINSSAKFNFSVNESVPSNFDIIFKIEQANIYTGNKLLLQDVNWTIKKGEKWLLKGENGSGKTTLMSILYGDNPIAYKLKLTLFDKPRGSGESIWDIKSKIGFVSPEIQSYMNFAKTVKSVIQSGFTDTLYLNRQLTKTEENSYQEMLQKFNIGNIEDSLFGMLSSGEKKLVIIVRALIKNPPVLILDEPFQGVDAVNFDLLYTILMHFADENRTIIQIAHANHEILTCIEHEAKIENNLLKF